ncbi:MAG: hypothetical protein ACLFQX_01030 [Candidatus Kapaibacterium sp.]
MNNLIYIFSGILIAVVLNGCSGDASKSGRDFDFVLRYGVGGGNVVNTFDDTYTRDMIVEEDTTIHFELSDSEISDIRQMMEDIDIMDYPEVFDPPYSDSSETGPGGTMMPYKIYELKIKMGDRTKEIIWHASHDTIATKAVKLRNVLLQIIKLIHNKPEIKSLPEPKGAYL